MAKISAVPVTSRKFRVFNVDHEPMFDHDITLEHPMFRFVTMIANYYDETTMPIMPENLVVGEQAVIRVQLGHLDGTYTLLRTK